MSSFLHIISSIILSLFQLMLFSIIVAVFSGIIINYDFNAIAVFKKAFARDFYLSVLIYFFLIIIFHVYFRKNIRSSKKYADHIQIRKGKEVFMVEADTIYWINKTGQYITIHTEAKKHLHNASLSKINSILDPNKFARVHKSTIVSLNFVDKLISRSNGDYDLVMKDGTTLRLSRNYKKNVDGKLL